jgi:hypothetical protein
MTLVNGCRALSIQPGHGGSTGSPALFRFIKPVFNSAGLAFLSMKVPVNGVKRV